MDAECHVSLGSDLLTLFERRGIFEKKSIGFSLNLTMPKGRIHMTRELQYELSWCHAAIDTTAQHLATLV